MSKQLTEQEMKDIYDKCLKECQAEFNEYFKKANLCSPSEADRLAIAVEALNKILNMKREDGEDYKYPFNRCWHIASNTLKQIEP